MEYYLRYIEASDDGDCTCRPPQPPCATRCESRKHVLPLLECALPVLAENSGNPFAEHEARRDKMFFSRKKIQAYFGKLAVINNLLSCQCHPCKQARETTSKLDERERLRIIESSKDGRILFALMVYLRKLHFVYAWFDSSEREKDLGHAISHLHRHGIFNSLITNNVEKLLFKEACDQALEMLNPVRLSFSVSDSPRKYAHSQRFPFRALKLIQGGNFGNISKFEIFEEYCDPTVEARMEGYGRSVIGHGNEITLLFAMKSVKIPDRDHLALAEQEVLRMVSNIESPAAKNIITLLTCYTWRDEMHFVFPYIQTDLYRLLRQDPINDVSPWFNDQALPENELWKEMVGVASALSVIHTGLVNPFEGVHGRVFACHFDLKPANILVTADGKLKIGDFGLSNIQVVAPHGKLKVMYRGGDPKYAAPESRLPLEQTETWFQPHGDETAPALKYDVWSLACIMTEVLIYLLNRQTPGDVPTENPLVGFDRSLRQHTQAEFDGRFFDQGGVKECVTTTIEAFRDRFSPESPASQYMSKIIDLLSGMFQYHNHERISSRDVVDRLDDAETAYRDSRDTDKLAFEIRQHSAPADDNFKEIGWVPALPGNRSEEPVSFDKMNGITVEVVCQHKQTRYCRDEPCRIRLFRKRLRGESMPTFIMYWAVKEKGIPQVKKKTISFPEWAFKPTYLFQEQPGDERQFECILFPVKENIRDRAFIFLFQNITGKYTPNISALRLMLAQIDVRAFQGAVFQKRVSSFEFSGAKVEVKAYRSKVFEPFDSASVQFWTGENPILLPDNRDRRASGSTHSLSRTPEPLRETMVILSPEKALLQLDLSDKSRKFDFDENENVIILPRDRRYFVAVKSEPCHPWQPGQQNAKWRMFTTPAIRMDEDNKVKIEEISVIMRPEEAEEQLNKLWSATKSTPGNWDDLEE